MWKALILLGFIGCSNPVYSEKPTHYPVKEGMQWKYERYNKHCSGYDTVLVNVNKKVADTFLCTVVSQKTAFPMKIIQTPDTTMFWFQNDWPIVLVDGEVGDKWTHGKDEYEILAERPLNVLGKQYNTIQTYRFGMQEAVYWAGEGVGLVKIFYGYSDVWNLIEMKYKPF